MLTKQFRVDHLLERFANFVFGNGHWEISVYSLNWIKICSPSIFTSCETVGLVAGHRHGIARADVEFCPVPWTGDGVLFGIYWAITKWSAIVRADIVERIKVPSGMNQNNKSVVDLYEHRAGIHYLVSIGDGYEIWH